MKIANGSLLVAEIFILYAMSDTKQMTAASTATMRRLGPSGSLKKINITLAKIMEVIPKIRRGIFLGEMVRIGAKVVLKFCSVLS